MNFRNLKYFLVVAEELNISKAAEKLFITQQSLSNHISRLEQELGTPLFSRSPSLSLTYAGAQLVKTATQIIDYERQIVTEMDDIRNLRRGELRIGISHTCGRAILPDVLPQYLAAHPNVEISLIEGNSSELEGILKHGRADLIIGFTPILLEAIETVPLLADQLILVVPRKFTQQIFGDKTEFMRGKFSESADLKPYVNSPFILLKKGNRVRSIFDEYVSRIDFTPRIILETESTETAYALAERGMGMAIYPSLFFDRIHAALRSEPNLDVDFFPLRDPATSSMLVIAYSRERYLPNAARDFIQLCQDTLA